MIVKKGATAVIGFLIIFTIAFTVFLSSYYFIKPLLEKSRSKTVVREVEYNLIQLKDRLEKVLETKRQQFYTFPITEGRLSVDKSSFGFYYFLQVPYSPYTYSWYDIINKKGVSLDICEIDSATGSLINCLAENAKCEDLEGFNGYKICYYPFLDNISVTYRKVPGATIGLEDDKEYYISLKPSFKVVKKGESLCSIYEITLPGKMDKISYYITCNILKEGSTCYIPKIVGSIVLVPVSNKKVVLSFQKEKYIPNFNYFGCFDGYIEEVKVEVR
jgi:hypothetical protein